MIDFPVLIMEDLNAYSNFDGGAKLSWDLHYVNEGVYQIRITNVINGEAIHHKNITLETIMKGQVNSFTRGSLSVAEEFVLISNVLPSASDLHLILRMYVYGSPYYEDGRMLDFCDEDFCDVAQPLHQNAGHEVCNICQEMNATALNEENEARLGFREYERYAICPTCHAAGYTLTDIEEVDSCQECGGWFVHMYSLAIHTVISLGSVLMCDSCCEALLFCEECGILGDSDDMHEDEEMGTLCESCALEGNNGLVADWNYLPDLIFHPTIPINPLKPLYIGMEIEIQWSGWNRSDEAHKWLNDIKNNHSDIMFVKSDSSISDGFELVTHPMSPEWAMENFPFEELVYAVDAGANESHHSTGIHIHIDRGALTTAQLWKFLQVHDKQRQLCGMIGGRGINNTYANWDDGYDAVNQNMFRIARKKGEAFGDAERYVPINLKNENTIELRYMEGSIAVSNIKKNIQWVQALYDFTDHISIEDVKNGVLEIPGFLLGWIVDQEPLYPELVAFVLKNAMIPLEMPNRSA